MEIWLLSLDRHLASVCITSANHSRCRSEEGKEGRPADDEPHEEQLVLEGFGGIGE